jgi:hypothetical protein
LAKHTQTQLLTNHQSFSWLPARLPRHLTGDDKRVWVKDWSG